MHPLKFGGAKITGFEGYYRLLPNISAKTGNYSTKNNVATRGTAEYRKTGPVNVNISKNPHCTLNIHGNFSNLNIPYRYTKFADIIILA